MALLSTSIEPNPIAQAEQRRLQHGAVYTRLPVLRYALLLAVIFNLLLFLCVALQETAAGLMAISTLEFSRVLKDIVDADALLTGSLLFIVQAVAVAQGLQVASSTIAREKEGHTWEMLLLTGIDARRIVRGKWSAALAAVSSVRRPLILWRMAVVTLLCAVLLQQESLPSPQFLTVVFAPVMLLMYGWIGVGIATALGLLASVVMARAGSAYRMGMALHLLYLFASLGIFFALASSWAHVPATLSLSLLAPFDAGISSILSLLNRYIEPATVGPLIIVSTLYALLCVGIIIGLLRLAERLLVAQRAIPPP
jgi:ABC-type Na+ efflux pump permease subunit